MDYVRVSKDPRLEVTGPFFYGIFFLGDVQPELLELAVRTQNVWKKAIQIDTRSKLNLFLNLTSILNR